MVFWERCYHKKVGGLGLKNFRLLNEALLSKLASFVYSASEGILVFLRRRFVNDVNVPKIVVSSTWGSLCSTYVLFCKSAFLLLEKHSSRSFWHDNWLGVAISDWLQLSSFAENCCRVQFQTSCMAGLCLFRIIFQLLFLVW